MHRKYCGEVVSKRHVTGTSHGNLNEPRHEKTYFFVYAKTKAQFSCEVTSQLISASRCFRYIDRTNPLFSKFEISSLGPSSVAVQPGCIGPGRKPSRKVFSRRGSHSEVPSNSRRQKQATAFLVLQMSRISRH